MSDVDRTLVRITTDVGAIFGYDEREYELQAGDVVTLPTVNAEPLLAKDAAEALDAAASTSDEPASTDTTRPATVAEADAVAGGLEEEIRLRGEHDRRWQFADWVWAQHRADQDEPEPASADDLLMAGMGDSDAMDTVGTKEASQQSRGSSGGSVEDNLTARPTSAVPLGQLDALDPSDRRRAARQRGVSWPTTDEARDRLADTIATVMREEDTRVVDAPTSLGKTYTVASTRWGAREDLTGDRPVVHLLETRDARDEAIATAREQGGEYHVLRARHEACPVAAGDHDPQPEKESGPEQPITIDGTPASEWISAVCDGRGLPFSAAHRHLEQHNDQGAQLPCQHDSTCPAIAQWDEYREGDHPLVIATHNFAHVPSIRMGNNVVIDEQPDFTADLGTERVRKAVGAFLRHVDAPVTTWESFVQLALNDGWGDDAAAERDRTRDLLDTEPDREWYFENPDAHMLAPALARAVMSAEERGVGRRVGKTPYDPPRLDAEARDDDGWNREWVTVVLDADTNDVRSVRVAPDFTTSRSLIGLDAHPDEYTWQANTAPYIHAKQVLDPTERQLWRRYERGLRTVQLGEATRPLASGDYFDRDGAQAVVEHLRAHYGDDFETAITTKAVKGRLRGLLDAAGVDDPELMHYGAEKSRNDFADEPVGYVEGCVDPGDGPILDLLAELDLDAEPERSETPCAACEADGCEQCDGTGYHRAHGRAFEGADADAAASILASVRENHVAQAAGRYARNPDDPDSTATVFIRTDAAPDAFVDVEAPGVAWTYGKKQRRIVETLTDAPGMLTTREIAREADCSKEHVRQTLEKFGDRMGDAIHAVESAGDHGATLYHADGLPNSGVVELGAIANSPVLGSYTYGLAIRDPNRLSDAAESAPTPTDSDGSAEWAWREAATDGDPPS